MSSSYPSKRLFQNDFLEKLTHVHPAVPLVIWGPTVCVFMWKSVAYRNLSVGTLLGWMALGVFVWTLTEYVVHRFLFHFPAKSDGMKHLVYFVHGMHHDQPDDPTRLVLPPFFAVVFSIVFYHLFEVFVGDILIDAFFPGFILGYLCYDYTHFATHHFTPMTRWGRWIKQNHMLHHFADSNLKIGVSSPLWDFVFGTFSARKPKRELEQRI